MIRPITVLTFVLACGSGMYLYQAKHRVHLLDQQIDQIVTQTETLREQSRALHAEWMLLNDPDRLHRLAAQYLANLQPVAPTQFTDLNDLDSRLPPPVVPTPPVDAGAAVASAAPAAPTTDEAASGASPRDPAATDQPDQGQDGATDQANAGTLPVPPPAPLVGSPSNLKSPQVIAQAPPTVAAPRPVIAQAPHPAVRVADALPIKPQTSVAPVRTPQHVPVWKPAMHHPLIAEAAPQRFIRPEARPPVLRPQPAPPRSAFGGSMLGMAHGMSSLPQPVPLNASYSNAGG
jgi:hypothetical protein